MLEDESGRIRLVGEILQGQNLVTGVIIGALGAETAEGDFKVVDICFPGLAPQPFSETELEDAMDTDSM
jgi:DNA polymerase delta subunit 2